VLVRALTTFDRLTMSGSPNPILFMQIAVEFHHLHKPPPWSAHPEPVEWLLVHVVECQDEQ
jgi:hypothetical protein